MDTKASIQDACCFEEDKKQAKNQQSRIDDVDEIFRNLLNTELKYLPSPEYIHTVQNDINQNMRGILVDWLVEVAELYNLSSQTLYLSANYIDRFLSVVPVLRGKLQLVGVSCMLIASKYEEIYPPKVDDFAYITDNSYTEEEVNFQLHWFELQTR
jgi:cyclin-A